MQREHCAQLYGEYENWRPLETLPFLDVPSRAERAFAYREASQITASNALNWQAGANGRAPANRDATLRFPFRVRYTRVSANSREARSPLSSAAEGRLYLHSN